MRSSFFLVRIYKMYPKLKNITLKAGGMQIHCFTFNLRRLVSFKTVSIVHQHPTPSVLESKSQSAFSSEEDFNLRNKKTNKKTFIQGDQIFVRCFDQKTTT